MSPQEALLVLNAIPGLSGEGIRKLIRIFEQPDKVLEASEEDLLEQGLGQNIVTNLVHFQKDKFLESEYLSLRKTGSDVVTSLDEDYPVLLKQITHAPIVLYIRGNRKLLGSMAINSVR
ncbi:MAG: hypothetical protein HQL15_06185 [Candidatus Omnitrophica bacterium]|nr:hypothetical protein [Candidatus Omnitrophota bacterium]